MAWRSAASTMRCMRQAAVRHQGRIAFLAARVVAVVVDAVRVPGERGVAEVERVAERRSCRSRHGRCAPGSARSPWSSGPAARRAGRSRRIRRPPASCRLLDRVAHGEHEDVARAAGLGNDVGDLGLLERRLAGAQAAHDLDPAAGAHAARHRDRRQHDALVGMAVGADARSGAPSRPKNRLNQCGGSSLPLLEACRIHVEGAGGAAHGHQADIVLDRAHPADPGPQGPPSLRPSSPPCVSFPRLLPGESHDRRRFSNKEGPAFAGPSMIRKIAAVRSSSTSCIRSAPAGVPSRRPLPT